ARLLLWARAEVNAVDGLGATALHYAAGAGHHEVVKELLQAQADSTARDGQQQTPLHYAASGMSPDVVHALLASGGNPCALDAVNDTPLSIALQLRNHEVAMAMVKPPAAKENEATTSFQNSGQLEAVALAGELNNVVQ
ncbi:unnamed protein product, partial [Polarella glacialis]